MKKLHRMENKDFYNSLSSVYDDMIDFDAALKRRTDLLSNITDSYKTGADLGCGTGIDSIALFSLGLTVDAFDLSDQMISHAKQNANKYNAEISFYNFPLEDISVNRDKSYDLIVSLGNTLANLNEEQLKKTLSACNNLLNENGRIVFQILNYNLVKENIHVINETENSKFKVTRYYQKDGDGLVFKIKYIDKESETTQLIETQIYPHDLKTIMQICNDINLRVDFFGGLDLCHFDSNTSKDLVVIAERKGV
jgi:2-polyprenyl-3-methyl-5-hydroxy-6-metoxy-1,4-benzoquinol methylase